MTSSDSDFESESEWRERMKEEKSERKKRKEEERKKKEKKEKKRKNQDSLPKKKIKDEKGAIKVSQKPSPTYEGWKKIPFLVE